MIFAIAAAALAWSGQDQAVLRLSTPEEAAAARAAFAPNIPPVGGDWRELNHTAEGGLAVDVAHIEARESMRTVWIVRAGGPAGSYVLMRLELDCAMGAGRPLWFAVHAASGANLVGFKPTEEMRPFGANSGGELIAATACHGEVPDGPGYPTHQAFAAANPGPS